MTLVALGTVRSCGATTVALGLAATWPADRPVLLVEADPAGGTLAASAGWAPEPGLVSLAAAARRLEDASAVLEHAQLLPGGAAVLAAPGGAEQSVTALAMASGLLDLLGELERDVLLDCGRLQPSQGTAPTTGASASSTARFLAADIALLAARPRLSDLHAAAVFLGDPAVQALAGGRLRLVLVGNGAYHDGEIADALGVEVAARLPFDPEAAEALCHIPASARQLRHAPLVRALRTLAGSLVGGIASQPADASERVGPSPLRLTLSPFRARKPAPSNGKAEVAH